MARFGCRHSEGKNEHFWLSLGHPDFDRKHQLTKEQRFLLERIPRLRDRQEAWLLLTHCAGEKQCLDANVECFNRTL